MLSAVVIGSAAFAAVPEHTLSDAQMAQVHGALLEASHDATDHPLADDAQRERAEREALYLPLQPKGLFRLLGWPLVMVKHLKGEEGDGWFGISGVLDTELRPIVFDDDDGYGANGSVGHVRLEGVVLEGLRIREDDPLYIGQRPANLLTGQPEPPAGDYIDIVFPEIIEGALSVEAIKFTGPRVPPAEAPSIGGLRIEGLKTHGSWIRIGVNP